MVWHHENVVKSAQHHRLAPGALPHDFLDGIIEHVTAVTKKKNLVPFVTFASDLFQIEVSHLYSPATNDFTLILHVPMVANSNLLNLYEFLPLPIHFNFAANISITPDVGQTNLLAIGHSQSFQAISSTDLHACLHLGDTFFCKGRKVMETNLKRSCLGALYMANSQSIQNHCRFKIAEAREKIFELSENTWAIYSIGTISTNHVCPAANDVTDMQIQSGDTIKVNVTCGPWTMSYRPTNRKQSRLQSRPWTGLEKSLTCSTTRTRTPYTRQCKDSATATMASSMPPFCWNNWTNWINEAKMENKTPTGPSPHRPQ